MSFDASAGVPPEPRDAAYPGFSSCLTPVGGSIPFGVNYAVVTLTSKVYVVQSGSGTGYYSLLVLDAAPPASSLYANPAAFTAAKGPIQHTGTDASSLLSRAGSSAVKVPTRQDGTYA